MSVWTVVPGLRGCICYRRAWSHNRAVPPAPLSLTAPVRSVIACLTFLKWVQSISVHADIHLIGNMSHCFRSLFPKRCFLIYFFCFFGLCAVVVQLYFCLCLLVWGMRTSQNSLLTDEASFIDISLWKDQENGQTEFFGSLYSPFFFTV